MFKQKPVYRLLRLFLQKAERAHAEERESVRTDAACAESQLIQKKRHVFTCRFFLLACSLPRVCAKIDQTDRERGACV